MNKITLNEDDLVALIARIISQAQQVDGSGHHIYLINEDKIRIEILHEALRQQKPPIDPLKLETFTRKFWP